MKVLKEVLLIVVVILALMLNHKKEIKKTVEKVSSYTSFKISLY